MSVFNGRFLNYRLPKMSRLKSTGSIEQKKDKKTYGSRCSQVVTHLSTSRPACSLNMAERTGSLLFYILWPYVKDVSECNVYIINSKHFSGEHSPGPSLSLLPGLGGSAVEWSS